MTWRQRFWSLPPYVVLSGWALFVGVPILWMAMSSLKTRTEIFADPFGLPADPQWGNYGEAWNVGVGGFLLNSAIVTVASVGLILITSSLASYALARQRFLGRTAVYALLIASFAIPLHSVLVPLYQLLHDLGLLNTLPGLIGPYTAFAIPFSVLLLYGYFVDFPRDLEDAARVDGAGTMRMFWSIVLPIVRPGLVTVAIFQAVFIWNEFLLALIIVTDTGLQTLPLGLSAFQGRFSANLPLIFAALSIATIPLLFIYVVLQRHFTESLAGFAKG